ncbi:MAG: FAD-dependent oxidoreductase, partial [Planctomycetes bacterium]|nr:FAD-dependent oxidoreductase [Planctomycetota bacterium]
RTKPTVNFPALIERISRTVDAMSASQRDALLSTPNLDFIPEHAEFVEDRVIRAGSHRLTAPKTFIATGSRPSIPDIPGLADTPFMTSQEALRRTDLPERLLVIGASYIAVELGTAYAGAGARVDFIVRSRFLRREDEEISLAFAKQFGKTHAVHQGMVPQKVRFQDGLFTVTSQDKTLQGDALLVATGTVPCTENLGLHNTGIYTTTKGFIQVDDYLQTSASGVYALGDCIGRYL